MSKIYLSGIGWVDSGSNPGNIGVGTTPSYYYPSGIPQSAPVSTKKTTTVVTPKTVTSDPGKKNGGGTPPVITEDPGTPAPQQFQSLSYAAIPTPDLGAGLSDTTLASILTEAKQYGELGYSGALSQIDENIISSGQSMDKAIASNKSDYVQMQQDTITQAAQAAIRFMANANRLGRLEGGQAPQQAQVIEAAGVEGVSKLETELGKKIAEQQLTNVQYVDAQNRLRVGLVKEQGLATAVKNLELQDAALDREFKIKEAEFQNRLSQSADLRDWQTANLAYQQFQANVATSQEELDLKKQQAQADLTATNLANQITQRTLAGGGTSSNNSSNYFTIPGTSYKITIDEAIKEGYISSPTGLKAAQPSVNDLMANQILDTVRSGGSYSPDPSGTQRLLGKADTEALANGTEEWRQTNNGDWILVQVSYDTSSVTQKTTGSQG